MMVMLVFRMLLLLLQQRLGYHVPWNGASVDALTGNSIFYIIEN